MLGSHHAFFFQLDLKRSHYFFRVSLNSREEYTQED